MTKTPAQRLYDQINETLQKHGEPLIDYVEKITDYRYRVHNAPSEDEAYRLLVWEGTDEDLNRLRNNGISHFDHGQDYIDIVISIMPPHHIRKAHP